MKTDRKGIMSACDYSIASLQNIKKGLMDIGNPKQELNWAIGGIIIALASNLLAISQDVISQAPNQDEPSALNDIKEIQVKFNQFVEGMIGNE